MPATSATDGARGDTRRDDPRRRRCRALARLLSRHARFRARSDLRRPALRDARMRRGAGLAGRAGPPGRRPAGRVDDRPRRPRAVGGDPRARGPGLPRRASRAGVGRRPLPRGALLASVGRPPLLRGRPRRQPRRVGAALMRAVRLAGTEAIEVVAVPDPVLTGERDAIVRVTHTAICGADLLPYHGWTPGFEAGTILGHEFVGTVEDAGDALAGVLAPGQRVVNTSMTSDGSCAHCRAGRPTQCTSRALFGYSGVYERLDGGQAELVRVPRADRCLWPVPDAVSSEDAVFVADILPTGFLAVQRARVGPGDVVVVLGCGPVGLMVVLCAVGAARRVIAVDGIEARRALAQSLGAQAVSPDGAVEAVAASTGAIGADGVIE